MKNSKILAINPGSTSTKIAVYENETPLFVEHIKHSSESLQRFNHINEQLNFRKDIIVSMLNEAKINLAEISIIVGRGGIVKPIESGIYEVNERMVCDLQNASLEHASNLGGLIAYELANALPEARAFIADPVVVDELDEVARVTGHPMFSRQSIFHALNQKAVARIFANSINKKYEDLNLIVAHLGGGITVGAHKKGRVVDVNNGLDGDGPFSPERCGTLPAGDLVRLCFSGNYHENDVLKMITGQGGYVAYFGTNDAQKIASKAGCGDKDALLIQNAMAYQVGKEIGALAASLNGMVDAIIITGGIAHNNIFVESIQKMVAFIAPVKIYPGEDELNALAMNGLMVLKDDIIVKEYL